MVRELRSWVCGWSDFEWLLWWLMIRLMIHSSLVLVVFDLLVGWTLVLFLVIREIFGYVKSWLLFLMSGFRWWWCWLVREAVFPLVWGILSWCSRGVSLRLNLGELGLIVGVWGLMRCVVDGEWFVIDAFMSVSGGVGLTLHFVVGLVSLWSDDGSRMLNWSLWWVN